MLTNLFYLFFFLLSPGVLTKSTGNLLQGEPGGKMNVFFLTPPDA